MSIGWYCICLLNQTYRSVTIGRSGLHVRNAMRELQILSPDGKSHVIQLQGDRITLGRSSAAELCFPDDTGLSRQHLAFEREGEAWILHDLNSKNGTILNGAKVTTKAPLRPGDRVMAGHLILVYD